MLADVLGLQENTALRIAEALNVQLSPQQQQMIGRNTAKGIEAYDANQAIGADGREMEVFMTEVSWLPFRTHRRKLFASDWWQLFPQK